MRSTTGDDKNMDDMAGKASSEEDRISTAGETSLGPSLNVIDTAIHVGSENDDLTIALPRHYSGVSSLAVDIGGSLIKLAYISMPKDDYLGDGIKRCLQFVKFEKAKINECLDFISTKQLHLGDLVSESPSISSSQSLSSSDMKRKAVIKATGGGSHGNFADIFKERLGVSLDREDEMDSLVAGANFLLKTHHEAFTHMNGEKEFVQIDQNSLYPYLLVNIGSGVSMIKVDGEKSFQRVSGTNLGGGTYLGLGRLLTKCNSFDELLELSKQGDNTGVDMLVGDIYGGMDYSKIGLSASTIASSFGKAMSKRKELSDYKPEDISSSLLKMISSNIAQISYLNAHRYGLKRIFFGGFFIRGHVDTMTRISVAIDYWSNHQTQAMFLRHEGYLGVIGALMSDENKDFE